MRATLVKLTPMPPATGIGSMLKRAFLGPTVTDRPARMPTVAPGKHVAQVVALHLHARRRHPAGHGEGRNARLPAELLLQHRGGRKRGGAVPRGERVVVAAIRPRPARRELDRLRRALRNQLRPEQLGADARHTRRVSSCGRCRRSGTRHRSGPRSCRRCCPARSVSSSPHPDVAAVWSPWRPTSAALPPMVGDHGVLAGEHALEVARQRREEVLEPRHGRAARSGAGVSQGCPPGGSGGRPRIHAGDGRRGRIGERGRDLRGSGAGERDRERASPQGGAAYEKAVRCISSLATAVRRVAA